ncbi:hypothetical protein TBR22_A06610 [Luteitalea sp. TBR-22]|uniref:acyl carrier protein n=1 Tax=Luteitalea sp. TBR-22 TaxID=2802971 RepID=UPI001AF386E7|nr:acyl carrier protein [Luteitalea sp. TBR-22]BCS31460.1 hypothetical protein TBR22_A06610 [Luteitalea sp. TBR-22]
MTDAQIERVLLRVAEAARREPGSVNVEHTFEDIALDSLSAVSLAGDLEEEFDVTLPNEEILRLRTVADAIACLDRALAPRDDA